MQAVSTKEYQSIPIEIIQRKQWVLWNLEPVIVRNTGKQKFNKETGQPEFTKVPYQVNGRKADSTNPKTWTSYHVALQSSNEYSGIGYVLTASDPYTVIDLDDCITDGKIQQEAQSIVDSLDSYTEYSQSGTGLHIFIKGEKPGTRSKNPEKNFEIYDNQRFIVMTGNHVEDTPTEINERQDILNYIYDMYFSEPVRDHQVTKQSKLQPSPALSDEEVLSIGFKARNGDNFKALYSGDCTKYGSQSEADQALCNYIAFYTQDGEQIDRIFIRSGLYREKWDRADYKAKTIQNAIDGLKNTYQKNDFRLIVNEPVRSAPNFIGNKDGSIKKTLSNLREMILFDPKIKGIGFDEFSHEVTLNKTSITDEFIADLRLSIDKQYHITFTKEDILQMVSSIAREENSYHPIKQIIESKPWDGVQRAETLFIDYLGANDNNYTRAVAKKWLAGAVARIYEPGIKMEMVPVLQGKQGVGKSTIASKLGGEYFVDSLASLGKTKDDYQLLIGSWIIELGELASFNSTETEKVKSFISARFDKIRLPYATIPQKYNRTCVFIGTTNNVEFLNDLTGNRRFFPIPLDGKAKNDVFTLDNETIQQIWSEALTIYKNGEKLFLDDEADLEAAEQYRHQATEESLFFINIDDYLEMKVPENWDSIRLEDQRFKFQRYQHGQSAPGTYTINKTTAKEVAYMLGLDGKDRNANAQMKKIKLYLDNLHGWEQKPVYIKGKTQRGYMRK